MNKEEILEEFERRAGLGDLDKNEIKAFIKETIEGMIDTYNLNLEYTKMIFLEEFYAELKKDLPLYSCSCITHAMKYIQQVKEQLIKQDKILKKQKYLGFSGIKPQVAKRRKTVDSP